MKTFMKIWLTVLGVIVGIAVLLFCIGFIAMYAMSRFGPIGAGLVGIFFLSLLIAAAFHFD